MLGNHVRETATKNGAAIIDGLFMGMGLPQENDDPYVLQSSHLGDKSSDRKGVKKKSQGCSRRLQRL